MKKKRLLVLFIQLALMVILAISFYSYVQKEVKPVKVYTYSQDLEKNESVTLGVLEIPAKAVQEDMLLVNKNNKKAELEKKVVSTDVNAGQYVYSKQLMKATKVDKFETMDLSKYRKVSLPITFVDGFGGDVKRGDSLDLIFTGQGEKEEEGENSSVKTNFQYSKAFLQDVLVYNVTTTTGYRFENHSGLREGEVTEEGEEIQTSNGSEELAVVTLAVTLDQAEEIQARQAIGEISFASRFEENQSYETLGFVIGEYEKIFSAPANAETGRATINQN